ncbi:MAG: RluA family pseudouridine synthase [Candidatus Omnitrophica bacterium]|nr:RluA family pseudouridine synthase [Candidatus Omnitrophota bacterium]MBD3268994.1 RluA family pseudouridine synthase [Candidatus Omnitrophota bacterium]
MEKRGVFVVTPEWAGERLDKFLVSSLKEYSRNKISRFLKDGKVKINGVKKKPGFKISEGDKIEIIFEVPEIILQPYDFNVKIIYEDRDVLVVDKPGGLTVHPPNAGFHRSLVNALIARGKQLSGVDSLRPGIVHRLDKETSGVMVLAKNILSYEALVESFKKREVEKVYKALVWGEIKKDKFSVNLPLARDSRNRMKMKVSFLRAKNALTDITVEKRLRGATFLGIELLTGRMHQIRVHLKFLGYPVVGDKKYGIKDNYKEMFLHSFRIAFKHPRTDKRLEFTASLPERFRKFMENYKN